MTLETETTNRSIELSSIPVNKKPGGYIATEELIQAVEIAIALNKPLVVSGEPGTGKTQLAHWVAAQLSEQTKGMLAPFAEKAIVFNTKSGSAATDLFYYYDAVGHFRSQQNKNIADFIELKAMGLAIVLAHGKRSTTVASLLQLPQLKGEKKDDLENKIVIEDEPQSSVVLIDEIDKAPRDFPNDLLNEMENYEFDIREMGVPVKRPQTGARTVVIMTSNSEKNLPNAFLRRCVFYHIPFPEKDKLLQITKSRMGLDDAYNASLHQAVNLFEKYRDEAVNKKPATSEFLDWIAVLNKFNLLNNGTLGEYNESQKDKRRAFLSTFNVLFKSKDDRDKVTEKIKTKSLEPGF